jgi:hypothetical protein
MWSRSTRGGKGKRGRGRGRGRVIHSFPGRVLSTCYTDPSAEWATALACGYATVCVCDARTAMEITSYLVRCGRKVLSSCDTNVCVKSWRNAENDFTFIAMWKIILRASTKKCVVKWLSVVLLHWRLIFTNIISTKDGRTMRSSWVCTPCQGL